MSTQQSIDLANRARAIYVGKLKQRLESTNLNDFLAVEPDSGEYFLGKRLLAKRFRRPARHSRIVCPSSFALGMRQRSNWDHRAVNCRFVIMAF